MPINGGNTGKDVTLIFTGPYGNIEISGITGFMSSEMTQSIDFNFLDGENMYDEIPRGWSVNFDFDRTDSTLDDYFAAREAGYYNGVNPGLVTIQQTIQENNGGITQYRYERVALKYDDAGSWKGDQKVSQKVSGKAGRRVKVI